MKAAFLMAVALPMLSATMNTHAENIIKANDAGITYMGRHETNSDGDVMFNFPGFTTMLNFSGTSLDMLTSPGSGYWMVETDNEPAVKMHVSANDSVLHVAEGLNDGPHSARITYCIEGFEFNPEVRGFRLDDSGSLLAPPTKQNLAIEFIGDSMTCGYGTEADDPETGFSYDTENHCLGFAYLTARALNADFNMVSRSGIGVYRNYGDPKEGSADKTMTSEYDNTLLYDKGYSWDFSRFTPDIICINLGTNDTSEGNYDLNLLEKGYDLFVRKVRERNPSSKIVLLTGSMLNGQALADMKQVLDRIASTRKGVYRFDMSPQDGSLGYGADWHPSASQSRRMADELASYLKTL